MVACLALLVLSNAGCRFSAATTVDAGADTGSGETGSTGGESGSPDDSGGGTESGDSGEAPGPSDTDDDGDGFTENEGDCDDLDPSVHPGTSDGCDGIDEDCDGETDEDAVADDPYEPNDDAPWDLGALEDDPEQQVTAYLHNDDDVDRFSFTIVDDGWSLFTIDISLGAIPDGATYGLEVVRIDTGEVLYSEYGTGSLSYAIEDDVWTDDGGTYGITVDALGGADCAWRYLLGISYY